MNCTAVVGKTQQPTEQRLRPTLTAIQVMNQKSLVNVFCVNRRCEKPVVRQVGVPPCMEPS
jgi:hypothetical protein